MVDEFDIGLVVSLGCLSLMLYEKQKLLLRKSCWTLPWQFLMTVVLVYLIWRSAAQQ